mmetsp:Transcript_6435/g.12204  ORF Transcript_6435/g.12204 Transcript_6435/m.12204 type:complete len:292 (+) Transcript_6435:642-1517(+)
MAQNCLVRIAVASMPLGVHRVVGVAVGVVYGRLRRGGVPVRLAGRHLQGLERVVHAQRVDAVALPRGLRAVPRHVAQARLARVAGDLMVRLAVHARVVLVHVHRLLPCRAPKTRHSGPGLVLGKTGEHRVAAAAAPEVSVVKVARVLELLADGLHRARAQAGRRKQPLVLPGAGVEVGALPNAGVGPAVVAHGAHPAGRQQQHVHEERQHDPSHRVLEDSLGATAVRRRGPLASCQSSFASWRISLVGLVSVAPLPAPPSPQSPRPLHACQPQMIRQAEDFGVEKQERGCL